ncbi:hypothetical protein [Pseudonocardia sp. ICBG1142]|uniref:hypothetical protein n=1 Tax=Pseudonocardia sp. ICBG1142 TaxID=2846760 RepID=UPI001CF69E9C|nr:hypothetical protein [Pseudonocardia sp. ICBG1142]
MRRPLTPREQCGRLLSELGLRPPLTLAEIVSAVEQRVQRRIRLEPERLPLGGLFGCTHTEGDLERIQYQALAPVSQQTLIILHELVHLLMGHPRNAIPLDMTVLVEHFTELRGLLHLVAPQEGSFLESPASAVIRRTRPGLLDDFRALLNEAFDSRSASPPTLGGVSVALYDDYNEWQAETMATIMLEWIETGSKRRAAGNRSRRILESLGEPER